MKTTRNISKRKILSTLTPFSPMFIQINFNKINTNYALRTVMSEGFATIEGISYLSFSLYFKKWNQNVTDYLGSRRYSTSNLMVDCDVLKCLAMQRFHTEKSTGTCFK